MVSPYITVSDLVIRVGEKTIFQGDSWQMNTDEHWAIVGPNGAGKSSFVKALAGQLTLQKGTIRFHFGDPSKHPYPIAQKDFISYVSFDTHRTLIQKQEKQSEYASYLGVESVSTTVRQYLGTLDAYLQERVHDLLDKTISSLSTGQMRKVLLVHALKKHPKLLILDEPFDGLDAHNKQVLTDDIQSFLHHGTQLILVTHHMDEIIPAITHVLSISQGRIIEQGPKQRVLVPQTHSHKIRHIPVATSRSHAEIVAVENLTVRYGSTVALHNITWQMFEGEHVMIVGPNGSGKSTLLSVIMGDEVQAYANTVRIFGTQKGTGESIWELKKNIGYISTNLHVYFDDFMPAYKVIISGLYDSIGLFRNPTQSDMQAVAGWADILGLHEVLERDFHSLSTGQQRLILIARACIKRPRLIIADEPCHGLDSMHRKKVLQLLDTLCRQGSSMIYTSHREDEVFSAISTIIELQNGSIVRKYLRNSN